MIYDHDCSCPRCVNLRASVAGILVVLAGGAVLVVVIGLVWMLV